MLKGDSCTYYLMLSFLFFLSLKKYGEQQWQTKPYAWMLYRIGTKPEQLLTTTCIVCMDGARANQLYSEMLNNHNDYEQFRSVATRISKCGRGRGKVGTCRHVMGKLWVHIAPVYCAPLHMLGRLWRQMGARHERDGKSPMPITVVAKTEVLGWLFRIIKYRSYRSRP